mmetsp:Transcript_19193/g.72519  ORF Transcript_19193/g.72519 Transcript_19193/m.72519 type:complete len:264 (-) Transcript_19193:1176-1967(-)
MHEFHGDVLELGALRLRKRSVRLRRRVLVAIWMVVVGPILSTVLSAFVGAVLHAFGNTVGNAVLNPTVRAVLAARCVLAFGLRAALQRLLHVVGGSQHIRRTVAEWEGKIGVKPGLQSLRVAKLLVVPPREAPQLPLLKPQFRDLTCVVDVQLPQLPILGGERLEPLDGTLELLPVSPVGLLLGLQRHPDRAFLLAPLGFCAKDRSLLLCPESIKNGRSLVPGKLQLPAHSGQLGGRPHVHRPLGFRRPESSLELGHLPPCSP